jgi:hypothetical protein
MSAGAQAAAQDAADRAKTRKMLGIAAGVVAVIALIGVVMAAHPSPVAAPATFTRFTTKDGTTSADQPEGWAAIDASANSKSSDDITVSGVLFKSGSARIDITTDRVATLTVHNLMGNTDAMSAVTGSKPDQLDEMFLARHKGHYTGFSDRGKQSIFTQMGAGRVSEWTADGVNWSLGGAVHGYRASIVGGDRMAMILCQCQEGDWATLQPTFTRVINSVAEGGKGVAGSPSGFSTEQLDDSGQPPAPSKGDNAPAVLDPSDQTQPGGGPSQDQSQGGSSSYDSSQ